MTRLHVPLPLLLCVLTHLLVRDAGAATPACFELSRVAGGVYAAIRAESSANVVHGNTTIVVNDVDVVVVDAAGTPAAARRVIAPCGD